MSTLEDWLAEATGALNLPADTIDTALRDALLDVTRDAAHQVTRIAGPLTTYLIGLAVAAGADPAAACAKISALAVARGDGAGADAG